MDVVVVWTGATASAFQRALRLTNESFAAALRIAPRTVAKWHAAPDGEVSTQMQRILDMAYAEADIPVRERFQALINPPRRPQAAALRVAIAVVLRGPEVLLVQRRDGGDLHWQFPAGVVKPGGDAAVTAVKETRAETGVHCTVREPLGSRLHPATGVEAIYHLCDHLMGEAANLDPAENAEAAFVPVTSLTRFIPADRIFRPVLDALGVAA
ncbi:NUDIX hydrolase [Streptomyces sp. WM6373]|uniref:NUDIX hydrolase n=1 Tax=Streptomyces sp. WM6373 TaxID=1415556 RepID=UPI0006AFA752|nr:NUDIX hydrolase [Streptomyces sp. WM6373]